MPVNRSDHEEWFMLYLDNELDELERREVERFLLENPDLTGTMKTLQALRFNPDANVRMPDSERMYMKDPVASNGPVSDDAMEQILLYMDNEMLPEEKKAFMGRMNEDDQLQRTSLGIELTRMQPDLRISFPDKKDLYRRQEPLLPASTFLRFTGYAAAVLACIFGLARLFPDADKGKDMPMIEPAGISSKRAESPSPGENNLTIGGIAKTADAGVQMLRSEKTGNRHRTANTAHAEAYTETAFSQDPQNTHGQPTEAPMTVPVIADHPLTTGVSEGTDRSVAVIPDLSASQLSTATAVYAAVSEPTRSNYATVALMGAGADPSLPGEEAGISRKNRFRGIARKTVRMYNKITNPNIEVPVVRIANLKFTVPE